MERLKQTEVSPIAILAALVVVVLGVGLGVYFLFIQPKLVADQAMREFNTPEAQAKRDPDQRKTPASLQKKIEQMRAKEKHLNAGQLRGHQN